MTFIYKYYKLGFKILILRLPKINKFNMVQACRVFARHKSLSPPSDKRRWFSVDCVSWFLVTWSRRCWLNSKLAKTIKVHRQARLKTCLTYIITSVWKFSAYCNNLGTLSSSQEKDICTPRTKHWNRHSLLSRQQLRRKPRQSIQSKACSHALRHCHCA